MQRETVLVLPSPSVYHCFLLLVILLQISYKRMVKSSSETEHLAIFLMIERKHWIFQLYVSCRYMVDALTHTWQSYFLFLVDWDFLSLMDIEFWILFLHLLECLYSFSSLFCWYDWFSNMEVILHSHNKPTLLYTAILYIHCWI